MSDKNNNEKKECSENKDRELGFEELSRVRGGSQEGGSTIALTAGDTISGNGYVFVVKENYPAATLDTWISVTESIVNGDGSTTCCGDNSYTLRTIYMKTGHMEYLAI